MKTFVKSGLFLALIALISACGSGSKADKIAKEICNCSKPMAEIQEKAKDLMDNPEAYDKLMTESQAIMEEAEKCMDQLGEKYEKDMEDEALQEEVRASMKKKCPDIASMMDAGM